MSKILITGGAGYIGSILVPKLLSLGHSVTVLDRFLDGGLELSAACGFEEFTPVKGDARDGRLLKDLVPQHDVLIPLAALVGAPACNEDKLGAQSINFEAVVSLMKMSGNGQKVIYPTTNSGYGIGSAEDFCTEETPLNPISIYGQTKVDAEKFILDTGNGVTLRLATVFGMAPRMRTGFRAGQCRSSEVFSRNIFGPQEPSGDARRESFLATENADRQSTLGSRRGVSRHRV